MTTNKLETVEDIDDRLKTLYAFRLRDGINLIDYNRLTDEINKLLERRFALKDNA